MADERVQIKVEEVVGNDVVLKDINPKSSTKSIDDSATGASLEQTLDRMWNTINNKLSRVVNSVNGRTGVVVLNPSDVGLGNVDNVSYNDIKKWIINKLEGEFGNKRIKLFDSLTEVDDLVAINDTVHRDSPYYAKHGYGNDHRSYIGYIYLDAGTNKLHHMNMSINTVGYTDNTIVYDEKVNNNDKRGGGLGINIYKYEDALKVYNELGPKSESGLYIDKSKLVKQLYYFDGVYGDGTPTDSSALLYFNTATIPSDASNVEIFIDNRQVVFGFKLRFNSLLVGDLLFCNFKDYRTSEGLIPSGMSSDVMLRNPCLGKVTATPDENGVGNYKIEFYSIKPKLGWGLQYIENHRTGVTDNQIDLKLLAINDDTRDIGTINISGLNVSRSQYNESVLDTDDNSKYGKQRRFTLGDLGVAYYNHEFLDSHSIISGGLKIGINHSLYVSSRYYHGSYYGNKTYVEEVDGTRYIRAMGSRAGNNWSESYSENKYDALANSGDHIPNDWNSNDLDENLIGDMSTIGVRLNLISDTSDFDLNDTGRGRYFKEDSNGVIRGYEDELFTEEMTPWFNTIYRDENTNKRYYYTSAEPGKGVKYEFKEIPDGANYNNIIHYYNMSGLKINEPYGPRVGDEAQPPNIDICPKPSDFGITEYEIVVEKRFNGKDGIWGTKNKSLAGTGSRVGHELTGVYRSGGLGINVGKFLEIDPGPYTEKAEDYYEGGKLSVRIGKGLTEEWVWVMPDGSPYQPGSWQDGDPLPKAIPLNRIVVNIKDGGGLAFDDNGRLYVEGISSHTTQSTMVAPMMMMNTSSPTDTTEEIVVETPVSTTPNLVFVDNYGTTFEHSSNPVSDETTTINLGAGLKIIL